MTIRPDRLRACVLVVVLVMPAVPASPAVATGERQSSSIEDWYQLYTRAKEDIKRQAWAEAEKKLLQAKKSGPSQGPRTLVRGGLIVPFSADYYLGEVYMGQGRVREAIAAFDAAAKQNLGTRAGEFARLNEYRTSAVARLTDDLIRTGQADVTNGDLASARTKAQEARALGGNAAGVENLLAGIKTAEDRANARNAEVAGAAAKPAGPDPVKETPPPASPAVEPPAPPAYDKPGGPTTTENKPAGTTRGTANVAPSPVSYALTESAAMRQFFSGDYARALATLAPLNTPRALFYKACSRAGMTLLSGGADPAMLSLARQDYSRALSGTVTFTRDEPYISPRILQLLQTRQ